MIKLGERKAGSCVHLFFPVLLLFMHLSPTRVARHARWRWAHRATTATATATAVVLSRLLSRTVPWYWWRPIRSEAAATFPRLLC